MKQKLEKTHGNKKITTENFIRRARKTHGDKYSYTKSTYVRYHDKLIITCPLHGDFQQSPYLHLRGSGCSSCYGNNKSTSKEFIQKAQKIHGDKYTYELTTYTNNKTKIIITCQLHGDFTQTPTRHLNGDGCPDCGIITTANKNKKTTSQFIQKAQKIHGDKYDYSKSIYIGWNKQITIICAKHGDFQQRAIDHINYSGCPDCGIKSKGELIIKNILDKNQIIFERQKLFDECIGVKNKLPFDFYLPNYNILIEYDGIQHFKPVERFGGEDGLLTTQKNDGIKNRFAKKNDITLIRIKYNENVENKLNLIL